MVISSSPFHGHLSKALPQKFQSTVGRKGKAGKTGGGDLSGRVECLPPVR